MCGFFICVVVYMCGFCNVLCVFAWVLSCAVVCLRGFFNVMC